MIAEDPLPHLVEGRAVALQMCGENADANHIAELAAGRAHGGGTSTRGVSPGRSFAVEITPHSGCA